MAKVARTPSLRLDYESQDISADITPHLLRASYTDNADGRADEISVTLHDRDGLWRSGWTPTKGARLTASFECRGWDGGDRVLECGSFELDDLEYDGPPDTVTVKGVSVPVSSSLRRQKKSRAWERTNLRRLAMDIADGAGLGLFYEAPYLPIERAGQRDESDLGFLRRMCHDFGVKLKVTSREIAVYEGRAFDARKPEMAISRTSGRVVRYRFREGVHAVYRAATVSYWDPARAELVEYTYTPDESPATGQVLKINQQAESLAQAEQLARARLRRANQHEVEADVTVIGEPAVWAGMTVEVRGWDSFDAAYSVDEAVHSLDGSAGYTTQLKLLKILGY